MAVPFLKAAGYQAGQTLLSAAMKPAERSASYLANNLEPNTVPDIGDLITLYNQNRIKFDELKAWAGPLGINLDEGRAGATETSQARMRGLAKLWSRIADSRIEIATPGELLTLMNLRQITPKVFDDRLRQHGYRQEESREEFKLLREVRPGPSDLVRFALREVWDEDVAEIWGYDDEFRAEFDAWMKLQGLFGPSIPTREQIDALHGDGLLTDPQRDLLRQRAQNPISWARAYHRASWDVPSPTMGYLMLHRLRPNRLERLNAFLNTGLRPGEPPVQLRPFGMRELRSVLKIADYPTVARDWLAAISASVMTRVDIQRMLDLDLMPADEVYEQYLDRGYVPDDARRLQRFAVVQSRIRKANRVRSDTKAAVLEAFRVGTIGREAAAVRLYRLSLTDPHAVRHFDLLELPQQLGLALENQGPLVRPPLPGLGLDGVTLHPVPTIRAELDLTVHSLRTQLIKKAVAGVRMCYMKGRLERLGAGDELARIGIQPDRREWYLDLWRIERDCRGKEITLAQIKESVRYGDMSRDEAERRLTNLGYSERDRFLLLADVGRDIRLDLARASAAMARNNQQRQRALEQAARAARQQLDRIRSELLRTGSRADIHRWVVRGLIDPPSAIGRLVRLGMDPVDAQREVARALQDREKWLEQQARRASQRSGSSASGSVGGGGTAGDSGPRTGEPAEGP